jgi:hypothetical protein
VALEVGEDARDHLVMCVLSDPVGKSKSAKAMTPISFPVPDLCSNAYHDIDEWRKPSPQEASARCVEIVAVLREDTTRGRAIGDALTSPVEPRFGLDAACCHWSCGLKGTRLSV